MDMKEHLIRQYVSNIDFKDAEWGLTRIKEDMRKFLGEEPAIDVIYKKDVMLNEVTGVAKEFIDVDKIQIVFTNTSDKFQKVEFLINTKI